MSAYHNVRTDPHLNVRHTSASCKVMMRRWPCGCDGCKSQLKMKTFTERYKNGRYAAPAHPTLHLRAGRARAR